ncbi:unnamed protein product, partial [Closterium sp. Naga37s-1]
MISTSGSTIASYKYAHAHAHSHAHSHAHAHAHAHAHSHAHSHAHAHAHAHAHSYAHTPVRPSCTLLRCKKHCRLQLLPHPYGRSHTCTTPQPPLHQRIPYPPSPTCFPHPTQPPHTHPLNPPSSAFNAPSNNPLLASTQPSPPAPILTACNPFLSPSLPCHALQTLWADFTCGDGTCNRPFQYPAFGRFGCEADCGSFPNLTSIIIRFSSQLHSQQAAEQSSWNLCMAPQRFPQGEADFSVPMDVPDGDWVVVLNAPFGGIRGTLHAAPPGTRRMATLGLSSTVELAAWGYCAHAHDDAEEDGGQIRVIGTAAAAAAAGTDICRDTCVRLATCLPEACDRTFTEREVAGAFVDCARMCIIAPAAIAPYEAASCPVADMPTIFPNTPCNASASNSSAHTSRFRRRK